jgi:hypothetical protein
VDTAVAVVGAFQGYLADSQASSATPIDKRLTVLPMGMPAEPQLVSNRQREFAVVLLLLPMAISLGLAYRIENSTAKNATPPTQQVVEASTRSQAAVPEPAVCPQVTAIEPPAERMRAF